MRRLSRGKQILLYVAPFPALAFFKLWAASGPGPGKLLAVSALLTAYCGGVILLARRWDKPTYFDWVIAGYFVLLSALLLLFQDSVARSLRQYSVSGVYACLFAAACFPPLLGLDPFTSHYAKKRTPKILWTSQPLCASTAL